MSSDEKALEELLMYLKAIGPHSSLHFIEQLSEFILKTRQEARIEGIEIGKELKSKYE